MRNIHHRLPHALLLVTLAGIGLGIGCSGLGPDPIAVDDVTMAAVLPPPISGGTLVVAKDGKTAIAADPDRDMIWIVDLGTASLKHQIALEAGDEPGRVAVDSDGRAHVALRQGGAVVTIDIAAGKIVERRMACPSPRGIAYEALGDRIHVACEGGELVTLPAAGGAPTRVLRLDRDLRDVIVQGDKLLVTRFRSAEVLVLGIDGKVWQRESPRTFDDVDPNFGTDRHFEPAVAWRTVEKPGGGALMVHQRAVTTPVVISQPNTYTGFGNCNGSVVHSTVTSVGVNDEGVPITIPELPNGPLSDMALPVDIAISPDGGEITVVAAGSDRIVRTSLSAIPQDPGFDCGFSGVNVPGQPIAAAYAGNGVLAVQLREPAAIYFPSTERTLSLPGESRKDTGHDLFHKTPSGSGSDACASCHPEGLDDHRTWKFEGVGPRRTMSIRGGILATAPLHWDGDLEDMGHLMDEVFVRRMGGTSPGARHERLLSRWIDGLPTLPNAEPADTSAVERGKALYFDKKVACATCHSGEKLTNNDTVDVGTGRKFQVPTLMGIVDRAPFMHDGCAKTLRDRFDPNNAACSGGDKHGVTSHLTPAEVSDLVAYLETL